MLTIATLNAIAGVRHGFFTRQGGVSEGLYASLNCGPGSGDDPKRVAANRARALQQLGQSPDALTTLHQVHSARAVRVSGAWPDAPPEADGMVTATPGVVLGVLTADCAPVLLADPQARVIGALHAGWRGTLAGVVEATVTEMAALGAKPSRVVAAVGPCIHLRSYEVGPDLVAPLLDDDPGNKAFLSPSRTGDRFLFDLAAYVMSRLERAGLRELVSTPCDTYAEAERFFSYRRARHLGEPDYGRQLSAILLDA